MDKKMAGLLGAAAAIVTASGAHATVLPRSDAAAPAASYRDLLKPVPDALAALQADNALRAQQRPARLQLAQFHHHHHHGFFPGFFHHHHHHGFFPGFGLGFGFGSGLYGPPVYAPPPAYYGGYYTYYGPPGPPRRPDVAWCEAHYRSYNPATGMYLGYDHRYHPCP
jgi:hypothetical protein